MTLCCINSLLSIFMIYTGVPSVGQRIEEEQTGCCERVMSVKRFGVFV
jgi:hypothetical protein